MKTKKNAVTLVLLTLLAVGCGSAGRITPPGPEPIIGAGRTLVHYASCDELLGDMKQKAIEEMKTWLDSYAYCYDEVDIVYENGPVASSDGAPSDSSSESGVDFTSTNLQEQGVDEADVIKTDGETIYVATNKGVDIFKAWPLDEFRKLASFEVENGVRDMFLKGQTLVLVSQEYDENYNSTTTLVVLDVSNPSSPKIVRTLAVDGYAINSRMINNVVHLAFSSYFSGPELVDPEFDDSVWENYCMGETVSPQVAEIIELAKEENRRIINDAPLTDWLPKKWVNGEAQAIDCGDFVKETGSDESALLGLVSLNIESGENQTTMVSGYGYEVYASTEGLYLASSSWVEDTTSIHRFDVASEAGFHEYTGSQTVAGHIDNSFSMSEYDGAFRIATTYGQVSPTGETEVYSNVFVLDATNTALPILGKIEHIAEGEQIYAARFIGKRGYLVTFKKIDPLFVINLSDPNNPAIEGELEMPGFSTYLHPLDENHLIGLGKDAEDMGEFAWFQGLKLALFDVSEASAPSIVEDLIIGGRYSESAALEDHHAFTFDKGRGLLSLPVSLYENGGGGSNYGEFLYNGIHLYSVTTDGIETLAEIPLSNEEDWYGESVSRSIFVGNEDETGLYVLGSDSLFLIDMETEEVSKEIDLNVDDVYDDYYY